MLLCQEAELFAEKLQSFREALISLADFEESGKLALGELFVEGVVHLQLAAVTKVYLAAGKRFVLVVAIDAIAAGLLEAHGFLDAFARADEADMDLLLVARSPKRGRAVERDASAPVNLGDPGGTACTSR